MKRFEPIIDMQPEAMTLCLDFANTADWHASDQPIELLNTYTDLLVWAREHHILAAMEQEQLACLAAEQPTAATTVLAKAIELREAIYRIFVALTAADEPAAQDLAYLNEVLAKALPHLRLVACAKGYGWAWANLTDTLAAVLRPIALSAANLLTSDQANRVKQCEDDRGCGFLFIDTSKNRSRRWCSMESCGNRAKVQRYRKRSQKVNPE